MKKPAAQTTEIPRAFTANVERAVRILKDEGCKEVYLFGSLVTGAASDESDIDLGIRAYPKSRFFHIYGRLMQDIEHRFDLVDFQINGSMFEVLARIGEVRRIA